MEDAIALSMDYIFGRISNTTIVSAVLIYQEDGGSLKMGETYAKFLFAVVPRFLWPEKPVITLGKEISRNVMRQSASTRTATGITIPGEIAYNFGAIFAPLVGILFGLMFRFVYVGFRSLYRVNPQISVIIYTMVWTSFIQPVQEGSFAASAFGSVKLVIFFLILLSILGLASKRHSLQNV